MTNFKLMIFLCISVKSIFIYIKLKYKFFKFKINEFIKKLEYTCFCFIKLIFNNRWIQ